jgi:glycerol kinase
VIQCEATEASALGAAYLAGLSLGIWPDLATIAGLPRETKTIQPQGNDGAERLKAWNDALARSTWNPATANGE